MFEQFDCCVFFKVMGVVVGVLFIFFVGVFVQDKKKDEWENFIEFEGLIGELFLLFEWKYGELSILIEMMFMFCGNFMYMFYGMGFVSEKLKEIWSQEFVRFYIMLCG